MICFTTSVGALRLQQRSATSIFRLHLPLELSIKCPYALTAFPKGSDLLNQPLVNSHLVRVPRLASLTAGCLPRGHLQALRRQADGPLDAQVLGFCALDEFLADFFEGGDLFAG